MIKVPSIYLSIYLAPGLSVAHPALSDYQYTKAWQSSGLQGAQTPVCTCSVFPSALDSFSIVMR